MILLAVFGGGYIGVFSGGPVMERRLLKPKEVEKIYNIDAGTLANWRCQGRGPAYVKYGRKVLYPIRALEVWCESHQVQTIDHPSFPVD